ncbi:MAG: 4-(cytidine 5'-diphospho)-2-C-methyl-D-erythritol kinase [Bacteroidia bacterium]|nr:4-(cytidine 5'-diphospho)-2-C-methyl-D-erythritol kinase [Bacteroidia bacterium]
MVLFPNAKINLGLNILQKREDGYHELETVFYPIGLKDGLEFIENKNNKITFSSSGLPLNIDSEENIVVKAYRLLAADFSIPGLDIHMHKVIPFGAGLGGGSADAAFLLKGINDYFELGLTIDQLKVYAVKLGADCSFFLENKPSFASGIGEKLQTIDFTLNGYYLVLVKPTFGVGTKEAYAGIIPSIPKFSMLDSIHLSPEKWQSCIMNDFEAFVFQLYPEIAKIKSKLLNLGSVYASMSGSGSSVFGLFKSEPQLTNEDFSHDCFIWKEWI